ncbi:MAG: hypothetical protein ACTSYI_14410 [Promethearchaeota archaeon]
MSLYQSMLVGPPMWVYILIYIFAFFMMVAVVILIVLGQKKRRKNLKKMEEYVFEDNK